jgi:hypothetical protein
LVLPAGWRAQNEPSSSSKWHFLFWEAVEAVVIIEVVRVFSFASDRFWRKQTPNL